MVDRFIVVGDKNIMTNPVNPNISYAPLGKGTRNFINSHKEELEIKTLYEVMKLCSSGKLKDMEKGSKSIHVYVSNKKGHKPYKYDGVMFIDIDKFDMYKELKGFQHVIFNRFDELCKALPYLLCIKYSPSGNLHIFAYHNDIRNDDEFDKLYRERLCALCKTIKRLFGVDLTAYEGVIDTHLANPDWQLNINDSPVKWNVMCMPLTISKKNVDVLKAEYRDLMIGKKRENVKSWDSIQPIKQIDEGGVVVDKDYNICGFTGYEARTKIASATYVYFQMDMNNAREFLYKTYKNAKEIDNQLVNMVQNGTIEHVFDLSVYERLFGVSKDQIIIAENMYLTDVVTNEMTDDQFIYINAGTGVGKTEYVKNLAKNSGYKVIILQMNQAIFHGKIQGVEDIALGNKRWGNDIPLDNIYTVVEAMIHNCGLLNLSEYIIVIDESHLIQDYITLSGKRNAIIELFNLLPLAHKVIFMSATPKMDIKLYPFKVLKFDKIKKQEVIVHGHPFRFKGDGSKEKTKYDFMRNTIDSIPDETHVIFSNKRQDHWIKYGMKDLDCTYFNSNNKNDKDVKSILTFNKVATKYVLSTIYLGVGNEIKGLKEIHLWFDLDEGWDKSFVIQALGRPRDAEIIHVHFFYNENIKKYNKLTNEEINVIYAAADNLVKDIDGTPTLNIVAAKIFGIIDYNLHSNNHIDEIKMLRVSQMIDQKDNFLIQDIDLFKNHNYTKVTTIYNDVVELNTDGKVRINREETDLINYIMTRPDSWWFDTMNCTFEELLERDELKDRYVNKVAGGNVLGAGKIIWMMGYNVEDAINYFGSIWKAEKHARNMKLYTEIQTRDKCMEDVPGDVATKEELELGFEIDLLIHNPEYVEFLKDKFALHQPIRVKDIEYDESLCELMGIEPIVNEKTIIPNPFNEKSYKEVLKEVRDKVRELNSKKGGAKGGAKTGKTNNQSAIKIKNKVDNKVYEFESKTECMKFLNVSNQTFSSFIKGEPVMKLKKWMVIS